jgi:hypothetical protein
MNSIVLFSYLIGRLVAGLVTNILTGIGFNRVLAWVGLGSQPGEGQHTPSEVVGSLVMIGLMLFRHVGKGDRLRIHMNNTG